MLKNTCFHALAGTLFAFGLSGMAQATDAPSSGLGQSWPNTTDVSTNPNWHVYVFEKDGVRYVQVNDNNGGVHGAIATAGGQVLVLPIGKDAQNVTTTTDTTTTPDITANTVYSDGAVTINAAVQPTGAVQLSVSTDCDDPVECNNHLNTSSP